MLHSEECLGSHTKWNRPGLLHSQLQPCLSVQVPSLDRMVTYLGPLFPIQNWDNNTYITKFCVIFCLEDMAPIKLLLFITFDQVHMDTEWKYWDKTLFFHLSKVRRMAGFFPSSLLPSPLPSFHASISSLSIIISLLAAS